jgi:release factor glutamine methyltransferase
MAGEAPGKPMKRNSLPTETGGGGGTLHQALADASKVLQHAGNRNPTRDAELLLLYATGLSRTDLVTQPERQLSTAEFRKYRELIGRRERSEPIQYITGEREFYGLRLVVTPGVLIPRPETEHLVEAALERIPLDVPVRIVDVGTGSGAIAIALAVARPLLKILATDISAAALEIAKSNAAAHGVNERVQFCESDLLAGLEHGRLDMVVSNPPYIASRELDTLDVEVRDYEPATALFAGPTGVEIYERLIPQAANALRPGGWLIMEIGAGQQLQLSRLLNDWSQVSFVPDLQGIPRVVLAQRG